MSLLSENGLHGVSEIRNNSSVKRPAASRSTLAKSCPIIPLIAPEEVPSLNTALGSASTPHQEKNPKSDYWESRESYIIGVNLELLNGTEQSVSRGVRIF